MVDAIFADHRLAAIYDWLEGERGHPDTYLAIVDEFEARAVIDVGCGTGTLACLLAERGLDVVGVDPAPASLEVAVRKTRRRQRALDPGRRDDAATAADGPGDDDRQRGPGLPDRQRLAGHPARHQGRAADLADGSCSRHGTPPVEPGWNGTVTGTTRSATCPASEW